MKQSKQPNILGPVDTAFLYVEKPETPMNIGALTIFEGKIAYTDLVELIDARIHRAPIYQKRLIQAPLNLGPLTWAYDPNFYVGNHVFHVQVDRPGTVAQLRELVGHLVSGVLDRSKPLWEIYLIEGLEDGNTALFFKVHHCMVDGLSAVELFTIMMDLTPETPPNPRKPLYDPPRLPSRRRLLFEAVKQDIPHKWGILRKLTHDASVVRKVLGDKEQRRRAFYGVANLVNDNLTPIKKLAINGKNTGKQVLAWAEFSLAEVRAIKSNRRASVNDVMLTVLTGAVDQYLQDVSDDSGQEFLRVLVPVNMRVEQEKGSFGNRISVLPVDVPFGIKDPLERLSRTTEYTKVMKESALSTGLDIVLTIPALAPAVTQPIIWKVAPVAFSVLAHTWCTNVAGPQIPVYLAGHKMLSSFGYFPINPSMGMACVVMSYNQRITMTLVADSGIVEDVTRIQNYLQTEFVKLRKAAKVQEIEPIDIGYQRSESPKRKKTSNDTATTAPTKQAPSKAPGIQSPSTAPTPAVSTETTPAEAPEKVALAEATVATANVLALEATPASGMELFSAEWAQAYREAINRNDAYRNVSGNWEAGSLAFVIKGSGGNGLHKGSAVWLDLYKGDCREARSLPPEEAKETADFVIEGDYNSWMQVLNGNAQPLMMIMRGKLRLAKGSLRKLLPYAQSAQELVHSAQYIS
ncbi:MAG: wax ester/triacylglycerol synthase family O-acyltransferase [Chloroflexi bacterium]|nr:wax ester/triacylglycerol synthase family O-acyltransferase [Chloroflexota bacterium]